MLFGDQPGFYQEFQHFIEDFIPVSGNYGSAGHEDDIKVAGAVGAYMTPSLTYAPPGKVSLIGTQMDFFAGNDTEP